jgi:tetratricopeptide (TPR) repeat protein
MFHMRTLILWIGMVLALSGCSHLLTVKSEPVEADVFFINLKTGDKKVVGKTPLNMPMSEVTEKVGPEMTSGEFFTLGVEKPGFITQTMNIPAGQFGTLVTELDVVLKQGATPKEERLAKSVIDRLFLAQKFALAQQFERAQIEIDKILIDFPGFARALSMRASIYAAQKNYSEALKFYEEALKADPQMEDAVKMVAKVKAMQAGRDPASVGTSVDPKKVKKP